MTDSCDIVSLVKSHESGKKHLRYLFKAESKKKSLNCSVFVTGFKKQSNAEEELTDLLSKYGEIKDVYVDKEKGKYAIVEFKSEKPAEELLAEKCELLIDGNRLNIKPRKKREENDSRQNDNKTHSVDQRRRTEIENDFKQLLNTLNKCNDISTQMQMIFDVMTLPADEIDLRVKLCELLETSFKEVYPDCQILPFGSTTSQLGCKGCDLDLTLISDNLETFMQVDKQKVDTMDVVYDDSSKNDSSSSIKFEENMKKICDILRKFVPGCKHVFPLKTAHCPVIKFEHKDSGLHCDMSINNRLAVRNSELISCYCHSDKRFKLLAYTIRLWSKSRNISGKGAMQLTQYSFALMIIHYLQRCVPAVLPCLQENFGNDTATSDDIISGWNCHFSKNLLLDDGCKNNATSADLLVGFFEYFLHFNYELNIIHIDALNTPTRSEFLQLLQKNSLRENFKDTALCMPDPFELSHNVAQNMTANGLYIFKTELRNALDKTSGTSEEEHSLASSLANCRMTSEVDCSFVSSPVNSLCKLLEPKRMRTEKDAKKHSKIKYTFDVYGKEETHTNKMCELCAETAIKILRHNLKIQCRVNYSFMEDDKSNVSKTTENTFDDLNNSSQEDGKEVGKSTEHDINQTNMDQSKHSQSKELFIPSMDTHSQHKSGTSALKGTSSIVPVHKDMLNNDDNHLRDANIALFSYVHSDAVEQNRDVNSDKKSISRKRTTPIDFKREFTEPPHKVRRNDLNIPVDSSDRLQLSRVVDSVLIQASTFVNTWTGRRQQRRKIQKNAESSSSSGTNNEITVETTAASDCCGDTSSFSSSFISDQEVSMSAPSLANISVDDSSSKVSPVERKLEMDINTTNDPIIVVDILVSRFENLSKEPRCRVTMELKKSDKLSIFHSLFAFFKKEVLAEMKHSNSGF